MSKIKYLLVALFASFFLPITALASSGKINITGGGTVVQGNKITVTVTLSSGTSIGSWQMDLNYDKAYLQLVSSSAEAGGTRMVNSSSGTKSKTYTFAFKALKTGTTRLSVSSYLVYDTDFGEMSISTSNKSIKIMTQQELEATYSKDNNLKSLKVEGYELDQEFNKDTLEYKVNVPTGTTSVKVSAQVNDSKSSLTGTGEIEVTEGLNTVSIVVTAQNGSQKTYKLTINVEDQNPISVNINNTNYVIVKNATLLTAPPLFTASKTTINNFEIPTFVNKETNLTLVGLKDEQGTITYAIYQDGKYELYKPLTLKSTNLLIKDFPNSLDYIKSELKIDNEVFPSYKYSENSTLHIINAQNLEDGKTSLYLYDQALNTVVTFDESYLNESKATLQNYTYIIIAFAAGLLLMLIVICSLLHSLKKKQKKINKFVQKQEAKIEATMKLNDVINEVKELSKEKESEPKKDVEVKLSKKELKKQARLKAKEEKETPKPEDIPAVEPIQVADPNNEIKRIMDDSEEVYDLFGDDKKKKKKK